MNGSSAAEYLRAMQGEVGRAVYGAEDNVRFMLIAGAPFKEPIVPYGPFVMNTIEEIQQTLSELRNGTFIKETSP